jgi:hypothetical protein
MDLVTILRQEVAEYASNGRGGNILLFPLLDDTHQIYAVNAVDYPTRKDVAGVVVLARIAENKIVIEEDATDRQLVDALLQKGVPREQIVLAYAGEPIPDAQRFSLD